jgi:hypothetical protein
MATNEVARAAQSRHGNRIASPCGSPTWRAPKSVGFFSETSRLAARAISFNRARCGKPWDFTAAKAMIDDAAVEFQRCCSSAAVRFPWGGF